MPLYLQSVNDASSRLPAHLYHLHARAVKTMFAGYGLPECGTYLVALQRVSMPALFCHSSSYACLLTHWPVWR